MTREKHFTYKGQIVNYWNKLIENPKVVNMVRGYFPNKGWMIRWELAK